MEDSTDSADKIMHATYRALCRHGYANLSMQRIAEEAEKGKSLIYHHFNGKEDLMLSFLDHLTAKMEDDMDAFDDLSAAEALDTFLDKSLCIDDEEMWTFRKALMEMRLQAPYNENFATKFKEIDTFLLDVLTDIFERNSVPRSRETADIVLSTLEGLTYRKMTLQETDNLSEAKEDIKELIERTQ